MEEPFGSSNKVYYYYYYVDGIRSTRKGKISNVTNKQIDWRDTNRMTKPRINVNARLNIAVSKPQRPNELNTEQRHLMKLHW